MDSGTPIHNSNSCPSHIKVKTLTSLQVPCLIKLPVKFDKSFISTSYAKVNNNFPNKMSLF